MGAKLWVLPDKIFLPMRSIRPCAGYLLFMGGCLGCCLGAGAPDVDVLKGERMGVCRAKQEVCAVSFPLAVKASLAGGCSGITFNSVLPAISDQGCPQENVKASSSKIVKQNTELNNQVEIASSPKRCWR